MAGEGSTQPVATGSLRTPASPWVFAAAIERRQTLADAGKRVACGLATEHRRRRPGAREAAFRDRAQAADRPLVRRAAPHRRAARLRRNERHLEAARLSAPRRRPGTRQTGAGL